MNDNDKLLLLLKFFAAFLLTVILVLLILKLMQLEDRIDDIERASIITIELVE